MKGRAWKFGWGGVAVALLAGWGVMRLLSQPEPVPAEVQSVSEQSASLVPRRLARAEAAITRFDWEEAESLLQGLAGPAATKVRARLAIHRADCEGAAALLAPASVRLEPGAEEMAQFAERCAGATVSGHLFVDEEAGIWIRLQDRADEVLLPLLRETILASRVAIEKDLGAQLPRPLRLDLVRDLFSLAAVSGLPLEAAETTGTVAVARFGRVTMLSPRATQRGYPWQDTLAHEIAHLVLSRASWDRAPLWLQEGIAKRSETRWRAARLFDKTPDPAERAWQAQQSGRSVGVDQLGPSIAMLPSADAASIAFAEVTSFMEYWIEQNGEGALQALLYDLRVTPDTERALLSVSGLGLSGWQTLWREHLNRQFEEVRWSAAGDEQESEIGPRELSRIARLVELLFVEGHAEAARTRGAPELDRAPHSTALRFFVGRAALAAEQDDAAYLIGTPAQWSGAHGGLFALAGRSVLSASGSWAAEPGDPLSISQRLDQQSTDPEAYFSHALALDPLLTEVACEGLPWHKQSFKQAVAQQGPSLEARQKLCEQARSLPVRGAE